MKILYPTLIFLLLCFTPHLSEARLSIEVRSTAFFPLSSKFQRVYGDILPSTQLELNKTFFCKCCKIWFNVDEFYWSRQRKGCGRTDINILTFSIGPKYVHSFCDCFELYAGIGLGVACGRIHNHHASKEYDTSAGLIVKLGVDYFLNESFFLDIFCDYNYQPSFRNHIDIGGFKTGIGIGYQL